MPYKVLIADDDEGLRRCHGFALEVSTVILEDEITTVESETSIDTLQQLRTETFNLIILDNDFRDSHLDGHLPGIALLQLARREGKNRRSPILFCSADVYGTLKSMVEKFGGTYMPKVGYDLEIAAELFADKMKKIPRPLRSP